MSKEIITRYAPYIETRHKAFLEAIQSNRIAAISDSPFDDYENVIVDDAFFGAGKLINDFPALFDFYSKFMAGLDIDTLRDQMVESTINSIIVQKIVSAELALLTTDINTRSLPRINEGSTDINSVLSDVFFTGEDIVNDIKTKSITKFEKQLKYSLLPLANGRWETHLAWNNSIITYYSEVMQFYFSAKIDVDDANYSAAAKNSLWPFTILDFEKAALGALQGATTTIKDSGVAGVSTAQKLISGVLSGAGLGAQIGSAVNPPTAAKGTNAATPGGGGWGALIGGIGVGIASAF